MSDWYSTAREEDGRTDDEVMAEIEYRRVNPPLGTGSDDSVRVLVETSAAEDLWRGRCFDCGHPDHEMTCHEMVGSMDPSNGPVYCPCAIRIESMEQKIIRLRSRPATDPAGLDDWARLAEAWANVMDGRRIGTGLNAARIDGDTTTADDWHAIAAEYARLTVANGPGPEEREKADLMRGWAVTPDLHPATPWLSLSVALSILEGRHPALSRPLPENREEPSR